MKDIVQRIGIYARSETRLFMTAVAAELKQRSGATITLYCGNAQEAEFYRSADPGGVFDDLVNLGECIAEQQRRLPEGDALIAESRSWETRLGTTLNFLAVTHRHLGRGYSLGGFRHPRSRISEDRHYADLLKHYCATLKFWDDEIRQRRFDLILNGGREVAAVAQLHGVPYRVMAGSRYLNYHYWAWNSFYESPEFEVEYETCTDEPGAELVKPYFTHLVNRSRFIDEIRPARLLVRSAKEVARHTWWRLNGYEKAKGYYLGENLRYFARMYRDWRRLGRLATTRLADLDKTPFVFYPLHLEPEMALQGLSPEYFYQLSLIAAVSRDLPAGVLLAVKEAFGAVGRRPADFYGQIAEFKNVVMLHPLELGVDCVRRAAAVVTICGTAGFEAAVMGRPVVAFGRHNVYNFLPHVTPVTDEARLQEHLTQALGAEFDASAARRAGRRFIRAIVQRSFDMREYNYIDLACFDPRSVSEACDCLDRGLRAAALYATKRAPASPWALPT